MVIFKSADCSLLVPGARLVVTAELWDSRPTAPGVLAGRNGVALPM